MNLLTITYKKPAAVRYKSNAGPIKVTSRVFEVMMKEILRENQGLARIVVY